MSKIKIILVKGKSGSTKRQLRTLQSLGLGRRNSSVEIEANQSNKGMVAKVHHLVKVEEI
jgi:large subunit ribosomal protein L30